MSFLTINADEQDSELTIKSLEQQRLELEKVGIFVIRTIFVLILF